MDNETKKFYTIELMLCWLDHSWTTDYETVPFEEGDTEETLFKKAEKLYLARPCLLNADVTVTHVGLYNMNWDEPVDENGDMIEE